MQLWKCLCVLCIPLGVVCLCRKKKKGRNEGGVRIVCVLCFAVAKWERNGTADLEKRGLDSAKHSPLGQGMKARGGGREGESQKIRL